MRLSLILLFLSTFSLLAQDFSPAPNVKTPDSSIPKYKLVEIIDMCSCGQETHYAGGQRAMSSFINENLSLPEDINWGNTQRVRAYVEFVVEKDGSLTDLRIRRTNFPELDESILSVFRKMTNWVAGEEHCFAERTNVRVPVSLIVR